MSALSVGSIEQLNKKQYLLRLSDEQVMHLTITDMFSISLTQEGSEIAHARFQPLSSLNNLEMQPVYRITNYQAPAGIFTSLAEELLDVISSIYAFYTKGTIRPLRAFAPSESRAA